LNKRNDSMKTSVLPKKSDGIESTDERELLKTILKEVSPDNSSILKPRDANSDAPLNLSKILNILDGIPERTGQIIIMSTNHPDLLDDALLRPGRVDCMIEFRKASSSSTKKIIKNFYDVQSFTHTEEKTIKKINEKYTPAELFKKCSEQKTLKALMRTL
jgi:SpoVK/Ycf46/Vps4 family AAA+-type ATPase